MLSNLWRSLTLLVAFAGRDVASPVFGWNPNGNMSIAERSTVISSRAQINIRNMAAIGDSYSAGIGAGEMLPTSSNGKSMLLCCAIIQEVIEKQIPQINGNQDVILLSAAGNDAELTGILNHCVYQWATLSPKAIEFATFAAKQEGKFNWLAKLAKGAADWFQLTRGCEGQLEISEKILDSSDFSARINSLLESAKRKLAPNGMIYYTGYAKFFAEDMSPECDRVSWSTWIYVHQFLTRVHRERMNRMVDNINHKIENAVKSAGPSVRFVNYDPMVGKTHGRFCEKGVQEGSRDSNGRYGIAFYELDMADPYGKTPWKRDDSPPPLDSSFSSNIEQLMSIANMIDEGAEMRGTPAMADTNLKRDLQLSASAEAAEAELSRIMGDGYFRVFHPTKLLHSMIAEMIIWEMSDYHSSTDTCPIGSMPPTWSSFGDGFDNQPELSYPKQPPSSVGSGQQIALASYIHPETGLELWNRMAAYPSEKVTLLVANVLNGPDSKTNPAWANVMRLARGSKKKIIGYVRTGYLGVSKQHFKTMLGSTDLADWIAQIETDVELWYSLYPGLIDGIFFDEGWNECGERNVYSEVYRLINENTKRKHPGAYTVLNPGDHMPKCFEHSSDTLLTYESSYQNYYNFSIYKDNGWIPDDRRKIWHIIHTTPEDKVEEASREAHKRGAGLVQITDAGMPNPYNVLPSESFMSRLLSAVESGQLLIENPPDMRLKGIVWPAPTSLRVIETDYTSVKLSWVTTSSAYSVIVYRDKEEVARIPTQVCKPLNGQDVECQVTVGNLKSGVKGHTFRVAAISEHGSNNSPPLSGPVIANTPPLPDGKPIVNVKVDTSGSEVVYEADVLVPYAFIRILLTNSDSDCHIPSYPTSTEGARYLCSHYMIEGQTSYKYAATAVDPKTKFWPWLWSTTSKLDNDGNNMIVERDRHHYKWYVPKANASFDYSNIIVQGEGFNPRTNVFVPQPCGTRGSGDKVQVDSSSGEIKYTWGKHDWCPYNCEGSALCATTNKKYCHQAVNRMGRGNKVYKTSDILAEAGNCWGTTDGYGCKVQIRGRNEHDGNKICTITGDEMWWAVQDIIDSNKGGCTKCGSKHFGNGCMVTTDYVTQCGNHNRIVDLGNSTDGNFTLEEASLGGEELESDAELPIPVPAKGNDDSLIWSLEQSRRRSARDQ
ncbi:hypothetical protein EJ08DRAFT_589813 [Tothia fuscella]|uniref:Fibronectin type-III domain-containing protein n=1 Tax=Tothia fuscella TaxID=1048955 RepID=A0A9P4NRH9_9PEZI|nr:hypothetical protein EJ08DRAFT_589813 [Tothia fuscella]